MKRNWINEKDNLNRLINEEKLSYAEIGRRYECSGSNIKKQAKKIGIELPQKREINDCETFHKGQTIRKRAYPTAICQNCGKEFEVKSIAYTGKYCSQQCFFEHQKDKIIKSWENGEYKGYTKNYKISNIIREHVIQLRGCQCEVCHKNYINPYTNKSVLQVHHIDGDASNTKLENLQVLCPTHHAMTENFGSRNLHSIRSTYRKIQYEKDKNIF